MLSKPHFYNDIDVLSDDLNQIGSHSSNEFKSTLLAFLADAGGFNNSPFGSRTTPKGVIGSPADYVLAKNLKVKGVKDEPNQINVCLGNGLDDYGNLITIPSTLTITFGDNTSNYKWTDAISGLTYVAVHYQESSSSLKSDLVGALYPTRYTPGYFVTVGNLPTSNYILLASFYTSLSGNMIGGVSDLREYVRLNVTASSVILNPITPFKKSPSTHATVEDHVNAVGTGVVSIQNPHGLSLTDLGYSDTSISLINSHLTKDHLNGILVINPGSASAWNSFKATVNNPTSNAYLSFAAPAGAILIVNGSIISTSLGTLYASTAPSDGTYWAVCDASGSLSWKSSTFFTDEELLVGAITRTNHKASQYYILGLATIADSMSDIPSFVDHRGFNSFATRDVDSDIESQLDPYSVAGTLYGSSSLTTSLARLRFQVARAIGTVGGSWLTNTFPLTDGPLSNADLYHAHNFDALTDVLANPNVTMSNLVRSTAGTSSVVDDLHTHSFASLSDIVAAGITFDDLQRVAYGYNYRFYKASDVSATGSEDSDNWYIPSDLSYRILGFTEVMTGEVVPIAIAGGITFEKAGYYEIEAAVQLTAAGVTDANQSVLSLVETGAGNTGSVVVNTTILNVDGGVNRNKILYKVLYPSGSVNQNKIQVYAMANFYLSASPVDAGLPKNTTAAYSFNNFLSVRMVKSL
jgi:hypothetical protein